MLAARWCRRIPPGTCGRMSTGAAAPKQPLVVAIDGPAASGKGLLAQALSSRLNLVHLDTGLLYRALGLAAVERGIPLADAAAVAGLAPSLHWQGLAADARLRTEAAAHAASVVSAHPAVRAALLQLQRDFAARPPSQYAGAVMDGRDVGTVVCPGATAKLFLTADAAVRARRRHQELLARAATASTAAGTGTPPPAAAAAAGVTVPEAAGALSAAAAAAAAAPAADGGGASQLQQRQRVLPEVPSYEQVLADIQARDARDSSRSAAPCVPAADALLLDTTHLSPQQVLGAALAFVQQRL